MFAPNASVARMNETNHLETATTTTPTTNNERVLLHFTRCWSPRNFFVPIFSTCPDANLRLFDSATGFYFHVSLIVLEVGLIRTRLTSGQICFHPLTFFVTRRTRKISYQGALYSMVKALPSGPHGRSFKSEQHWQCTETKLKYLPHPVSFPAAWSRICSHMVVKKS